MRRILRNLFANPRTTTSTIRRHVKPSRLRLSLLRMEDRVVPTVFPVTLNTDSAVPIAGELRFEVAAANANAVDNSIIDFQFGGDTTIALSQGIMTFNNPNAGLSTSLTRSTAGKVTINGSAGNIFNVDVTYLGATFSIDGTATAGNNGIVLTNGLSAGSGGAIISNGPNATINLSNMSMTNNQAGNSGGAIATSTNAINLTNCTVTGNKVVATASVTPLGGGIRSGGALSIINSTVSNNTCTSTNSGIVARGGNVWTQQNTTITGSTLSGGITNFTAPATQRGIGGSVYCSNGGSTNNPTLTISSSTLSGNQALNGGSIYHISTGTVSLTGSAFSSNNVTGTGGGMQLLNNATVMISNCTVSLNVSSANGAGMRISGAALTLTVNNSTFANDGAGASGGAIAQGNGGVTNTGTMTFTGDTFTGNSSGGGGVLVQFGTGTTSNNVTAAFSQCTMTGNSGTSGGCLFAFNNNAGPTIYASGGWTVDQCTLSGNNSSGRGGAITVRETMGPVRITNSTLSGNTAASLGGAINVYASTQVNGTFFMENSTITGNSANGAGGLYIYPRSAAVDTIRNSTIVGNQANTVYTGGLYFGTSAAGTLNVNSTIISGNKFTAGHVITDDHSDLDFASGTVTIDKSFVGVSPATPNWTGTNNPLFIGASGVGNNKVPNLLSLNFYGGPTQTMVPAPGSPVINQGQVLSAGNTLDQRGTGFSRTDGGTADIGAVESFNPSPFVSASTTTNVLAATVGSTTYTFDITFGGQNGIDIIASDPNGLLNATRNGFVRVSSPTNAFSTLAILDGVDINSNGSPRKATFHFVAPGGNWDVGDNGIYTVSITGGPANSNKVFDTTALSVAPQTVTTFKVAIPQTFTVTAIDDNIDGNATMSLREAIQASNLALGADSIVFDQTPVTGLFITPQMITLTNGQLKSTDSVTIIGPTVAPLTVNGNNTAVANQQSGHVFFLTGTSANAVSISDMTITGGSTNGFFVGFDGGGLHMESVSTTLTRVTFTGNSATDTRGGAIGVDSGNLTLNNCTITGNSTTYAAGAVSTSNAGGAGLVFSGTGNLTINNSTISNNTASGAGGGIMVTNNATVVINNSTVSGNTNNSAAAINGGGVYLGFTGTLTMNRTTVSGNTCPGGGAGVYLFDGLGATLTNCTLSGNTAGKDGGGFYTTGLAGPVLIQNSTVAFNTCTGTVAGGAGISMIANGAGGTMTLRSTIVAENTDLGATAGPDVGSDVANTPVAGDFNYIGVSDSGSPQIMYTGANNILGTVATPKSPDLNPTLGLNGAAAGSPMTHAFLPAAFVSADTAIDKGIYTPAPDTAFDERNTGFVRTYNNPLIPNASGGDGTDIGAFEAQPPVTVQNLQIDNGLAQRSMVRSLTLTFSQPVTLAGTPFALTRNTSLNEQAGVTGLVNILATQGPANTVVITFLTSGANPVNGVNNVAGMNFSLPDGRYTLTINASLVTATADGSNLDGDNNGVAGGNYVLASAAGPAAPTNIFRFFGDQNGDGAVGTNDFSPGFKQANGTTPTPANDYFDYNENNNIGTDDFTQFKARFQVTFP
jgi:fibronectin-binding autotransporter adhesin